MPGVLYMAIGSISIVLFVTLAGFNKLTQMDLNPATTRLDAYTHPG